MAHYDIFRHHLAIKYPAYGHALWEPKKGDSYPAPVKVGDVGFIREGRFLRLFNVLLPSGDPSHRNYGVPEYHEQLTLRMEEHIIRGTLGPNNLCSARVSSMPERKEMADGPDSPAEVVFSCRRKQGAVLSLPTEAPCENTVALGDFGEWMIKHIDSWFAWVAQLGLGIVRMEDIILVTGTHLTRSWTNVAFPGGQEDGLAKFGAHVATRGDKVTINWKFSHEYSRGAVLNYGPNGEDPPEDQSIFIRGFRVARKLIILPRGLKAAAGPNPDPKGDGCEPDVELMSIPAIPEYRDPLHILLECLVGREPNCDMALVHDDDLTQVDGLGDDTSLEALQPDAFLSRFRRLKPKVHDVLLGSVLSSFSSSPNESLRVAILSTIFEGRSGCPKAEEETFTWGFEVPEPLPEKDPSPSQYSYPSPAQSSSRTTLPGTMYIPVAPQGTQNFHTTGRSLTEAYGGGNYPVRDFREDPQRFPYSQPSGPEATHLPQHSPSTPSRHYPTQQHRDDPSVQTPVLFAHRRTITDPQGFSSLVNQYPHLPPPPALRRLSPPRPAESSHSVKPPFNGGGS